MISIDNSITIEKIESLYEVLHGAEKKNKLNLRLPKNIATEDFSLIPSLIQLISTWIRVVKDGDLLTNISNQNDESELRDFVAHGVGFPAVVLAWYDRKMFDNEGNDVREKLRPLTQSAGIQMQNANYGKGYRNMVACFDHLSEKKGLIDALYKNGEFISKAEDLDFLLGKSLNKVGGFSRAAFNGSILPILPDLKKILFQLLKNTHEWARTDENNNGIEPNIRGMYMLFHKKPLESYIERYKNHKGLSEYFKRLPTKRSKANELCFFEISVFDSGPGLASRLANSPISNLPIDIEVDVIKKCLTKHMTAATGESKLEKGQGLDLVLQTINQKGFIKIRSGHASLFRDMVVNEYENSNNYKDIKVFDWNTNSDSQYTKMEFATGTVISIIYPLDYPSLEATEQSTLFEES